VNRYLYIFLDESGNLDFSAKGTKYFILCSVTKERPFNAYKDLCDLKYDLIESGHEIEMFHATEDRQAVRNQVFQIISRHLNGVRIDALIVEKRKTYPSWHSVEVFYPKMLAYLIRYIFKGCKAEDFKEVIVITDQIPHQKKRQAIIKGIKLTLAEMLPTKNYRVLHHDSKSCFDLQIADYCTWAIYKKWDSGETRPYQIIHSAVESEFDIFSKGEECFY
jgi:hypothetical protein